MIENEIKYVLRLDAIKDLKGPSIHIAQGYLPGGARLRRVERKTKSTFYFTYKVSLPNGEVEEFEQKITKDEFNRCFGTVSEKLTKQRFTFEHAGATWDIDIFLEDNIPYFCMAECEMPSGWQFPKSVPNVVAKHLLFAVDRTNSKNFSSKKLSDSKYARTLTTLPF